MLNFKQDFPYVTEFADCMSFECISLCVSNVYMPNKESVCYAVLMIEYA